MLRALELVGFKSFADRSRFEFPPGITAIVGPNGSGKSNVVDAIKWVLGEQSVRSLRGAEMADCIFNGSGSRSPLNAAEATLIFDNSARLLPIDSPEVHVTRRVYRGGEGEYAINRQPSRLRDIRELFTGTGAGAEAYAVIEQGKVDILLRSSPRDRRAIFEEAAGITRFKQKKIESLRRLERVEQNLLRLNDIVEEVESRLRGTRSQAAKARRYQEHAERLKELRVQVALADWRRLSTRLAETEKAISDLELEKGKLETSAEELEARRLEIDVSLSEVDEAVRALEERSAQERERIASLEAAIEHERTRSRDLDAEISTRRGRLEAMHSRAGDSETQLAETTADLEQVETGHAERIEIARARETSLSESNARLLALRSEHEAAHKDHAEASKEASAAAAEWRARRDRSAAAVQARDACQARIAELGSARLALRAEIAPLLARQEELTRENGVLAKELAAAQDSLEARRKDHAAGMAEWNQARQKRSALVERKTVLEELEASLEGVGEGVKEVVRRARGADAGPLADVLGVAADFMTVRVEDASLIDLALGERAEYAVMRGGSAWRNQLAEGAPDYSSRVHFVFLDAATSEGDSSAVEPDLTGQPGVVSRADRRVETTSEFAPLVRRWLGRVWIVESLADALRLAPLAPGSLYVSRGGETLAPDGVISVGPRKSTAGLVSRKSELRATRDELASLEAELADRASALAESERAVARDDERAVAARIEERMVADQLAECRMRSHAGESRMAQVESQIATREAEAESLAAAALALSHEALEWRVRAEETEAALSRSEERVADVAARMAEGVEEQREIQAAVTAANVERAKSEERLANLRSRLRQFELDREERRAAMIEGGTQLSDLEERWRRSQGALLAAEGELAEAYLRKEALLAEARQEARRGEGRRQRRGELAQEAQQARSAARTLDERLRALGLSAGEARLERTSLATRLKEDYDVELAELEHIPTDAELAEREAVDREISDLRRKLNQLGNVNLDALAELEELEKRHASLSAQYRDLTQAKDTLARIIAKINADSRRLFSDTLEAVRGHFQALFLKLFGGGHADIILEEGVDPLESGIEIVARPPGKEPRSISLLSGGEKTLTCVALLLAIFQYKPSPFCVLDEVDAALDEANIERFIGVLREFLSDTQFIVVTHSKKTMTCASTLHGVTMQESGVSKRVSVRFEDVSDDGQIRAPADGDDTRAA